MPPTTVSDRLNPEHDDVNTPIQAYTDACEDWEMIDALLGGTKAMRAAAEIYLPPFPKEAASAFARRLKSTFLFAAYKRTVNAVAARPFQRSITSGPDVPANITALAENIDRRGNNLSVFMARQFRTLCSHGASHFLVSYPQLGEGATLADAEREGARPYWVHIHPRDLIGWRWAEGDGSPRLTQIRYRECVREDNGPFGEEVIHQVRVVEPYRVQVWRKSSDDVWSLYSEAPSSLGVVPLCSTVYGSSSDPLIGEPPLMELAWLNVEHWQSSSDQRCILSIARVPILFAAGFTEDDIQAVEIGPTRMIRSSDPQAKISFVEHQGAAINAGKEDLLAIEDRMAVLGLELLRPRITSITATASEIDAASQRSQLGLMVTKLSDQTEAGLGFTSMWLGGKYEAGGSVDIFKDFDLTEEEGKDIDQILAMRRAREISRETFFAELMRRGFLADGFDPVMEAETLQAEFDQAMEEAALLDGGDPAAPAEPAQPAAGA